MGKTAALLVLLCVVLAECSQEKKKIPRDEISHAIVGGRQTSINNYPYQVSLRLFNNHFCGGVFIGRVWVLSAAHCCVEIKTTSQLSVKTGSTSKTSGGDIYRVKKIIIHKNYNSDTVDYDICLIETMIPIKSSSKVKAVMLGATNPSHYNKEMTVTGWGTLQEGAQASPDALQVVHIPLLTNAECQKRYREARKREDANNISDRQLCAGAKAGGKDSCQGDSGGPMVFQNKLLGIVSWGRGCGRSQFPGLYTNVNYFRKWILDRTGPL